MCLNSFKTMYIFKVKITANYNVRYYFPIWKWTVLLSVKIYNRQPSKATNNAQSQILID